jgi:Ni,Fe-hydrogenase I large subunit
MAKQKVIIDPLTRIEGHVRITCAVENGKVVDAWNTATLFRGFEMIMKNRKPADCWHFAMRICGVCPTPHGINAAVAAEKAMGLEKVPENAQLVRNMLLAAMLGYDHILWFYQLNAFDYVNVPDALNAKTTNAELKALQDVVKANATSGLPGLFSNFWWDNPAYKLTPEQNLLLTSHYLQSIEAQQWANQASAMLAGKFPHIMTLAAGGLTTQPTIEQVMYYQEYMMKVKEFVNTVLWQDLLAVAPAYLDLATYGKGVGNFLTWGNFDDPKTQTMDTRLFPAGAVFGGDLTKVNAVDPAKVMMYTDSSYFPTAAGGGKPPIQVPQDPQEFTALPPLEGNEFPSGKYDWTQTANFPDPSGKGVPMEVGPLAEVIVAYLKKEPATVKYVDEVLAAVGKTGHPEVLVSNLGRIAARIIHAMANADYALKWSDELLANIKAGSTDVYEQPPNMTGDGFGIGAQDAPRGALAHYCEMKGGMTSAWSAVPASNWNFSPRNPSGARGPVEEALIGTPVPNVNQPLEILRTVHTFDP